MASIVASVISILSTVIQKEYEFIGGLRVHLQSIQDEFELMMDFLEVADLLVQDHPELRCWVAQVRDVAYDVEDVLDIFVMRCIYHASTTWYGEFRYIHEFVIRSTHLVSPTFYGGFRKMYTKSVGAVIARREFASKIQEIKKRIREISESHGRYKTQYGFLMHEEQGMPSRLRRVKDMQYDRRCDGLFLKDSDLVGIEVPKKELTDLILTEDKRRKFISVGGMGGLGKTTLVKMVYNDVAVKGQFICHAWITVSQSFRLEDLFKDTIKQLFNEAGRQLPQELDVTDTNRLKSLIRDLLETKKYIVVFDDVWQRDHLDAIGLAFPKNQFGSRIIITTRNNDVGHAASMSDAIGSMYHVSPLDKEKSMLLFCGKAFPEATSCPLHLKQVCDKIVKACGGLPLAIEVIGSNLARRGRRAEEWGIFYKRLGMEMARNSQLNYMTKFFSLSYQDLPLHLKNCFLYLSIFPKDSEIDIDDLARLWIGEGFVKSIDGVTLEEVAESYLHELVQRSLVQVAETNYDGSIKYIRIHDIVSHILNLKASDHNITTFHKQGTDLQNNVRRLSIQGSISGNSKQVQDYCKSIRTLYLCKEVGGHISKSFLSDVLFHGRKLIKVLDLKGAQLEKFPNGIFKLFHLKYLGLQNTNVKYVPKSIGMLQSIQYLILLGTYVTVLPVEIRKLQHLRHLIIGQIESSPFIFRIEDVRGVRATFKFDSLKSLQKLYYIEAGQVDNIKVVTEIGKLIHLRTLGITKLKKEDGKELFSSLWNLSELCELHVYAVNEEEFINFQYFKSSDLPRLHTLILAGRLEQSPECISSLNRLVEIKLRFSKLRHDPLECLQDLPNLIILELTDAYGGDKLCFQTGGFPKLKKLHLFLLGKLRWVTLQENTLPSLQEFKMRACQSMKEIPTGIQYLMYLQDLAFSNMSPEFVDKLENLEKLSADFKRLLQIPDVYISTWKDCAWVEVRRLNKETGTFNHL